MSSVTADFVSMDGTLDVNESTRVIINRDAPSSKLIFARMLLAVVCGTPHTVCAAMRNLPRHFPEFTFLCRSLASTEGFDLNSATYTAARHLTRRCRRIHRSASTVARSIDVRFPSKGLDRYVRVKVGEG